MSTVIVEEPLKQEDQVKVIAGDYKGETGRLITMPLGTGMFAVVRRANGRAFLCQVQYLERMGQHEQH